MVAGVLLERPKWGVLCAFITFSSGFNQFHLDQFHVRFVRERLQKKFSIAPK